MVQDYLDQSKAYIREMTEEDLDYVIRSDPGKSKSNGKANRIEFYREDVLSKWIKDRNAITFVADVDDNPVGFALGYCMPGVAYLRSLSVDRDYAGNGVEKQLLRAVLSKAEESGCKSLFSLVSPDSKNLKGLFKDNYFSEGSTRLHVEKSLSQHIIVQR